MPKATPTLYDNLALYSVEAFTFFENNGDFGCYVDEMQSMTMQNDQTEVDITGKNGRKLGTLKKDKATTFTGVNALLNGGLLAAQTGGKYQAVEAQQVMYREEFTIDAANPDQITLSYDAAGPTGKEVEYVCKVINGGMNQDTALKQDVTAGDKTFTYDPTTKVVEFSEGTFEPGDVVCALYYREVPATVLPNSTNTFSKTGRAYIDYLAQDACDNLYRVQIQVFRAQFSGTYTVETGDQQTVHNFEIQALSNKAGCGTNNAADGLLWTYIVWDKNNGEDEVVETGTITPPPGD